MSRNAVRTAVAAFLSGANITGLAKVYAAMPWYSPGELFSLITDGGSGAVAWIHLAPSTEDRAAFPSQSPTMAGGIKYVHYEIVVMVAYQYLIPSAQLVSPTSPDAWVNDEDRILQALKDRIHADPQLGTGPTGANTGVVFEAAQRPRSLEVSPDDPVYEAGKIVSYHSITFPLTQVIQA